MAGHREDFILMTVGALTLDPNTKTPIVVLKDPDNKLNLPIWIGLLEAASMATELEGIKPQRPMTHDLLRNMLGELGGTVEAVEVTELRDNTYFAHIQVKTREGRMVQIDSRPSDAISLALAYQVADLRRQEGPGGIQRAPAVGRGRFQGAEPGRGLARQMV